MDAFDFCLQAEKFSIYVTYCRNKPDSNQLLVENAGSFFEVTKMFKMLGNSNAGFLLINTSSLNDCCPLCWIRASYSEKKDA